MGKLRSVNTRFWQDSFVEDLKPTDKLLFLYLLTNPLTNLLGVYEITINRICYDTGLTRQMVANGLEGFGRVRKAFFIENYMILPNWLKNQNLNRNMKIAVDKEFNALPKSLRDRLYPNGSESLWNGSESFPNGSEIESEVEVESECESKKNIPTNYSVKQNSSHLKDRFDEYSEHMNKQSVIERLAMNAMLGKNIEEVKLITKEFLETCYGDIMEKNNKFQVEQYWLNWVKVDGRAEQAITNQRKKIREWKANNS